MKFTLSEKLKFAKMHVNDLVPLFEISEKYGIKVGNLKYYCRLYSVWGDKAFKEGNEKRKYSREMKLDAIHDVINNHKSFRDKAIELMLTNPNIVWDWLEKYRIGGEAAITDTFPREAYKRHDEKVLEKEYKKLLEDLERTKAENEYLKKSYSLVLTRSKRSKKKSR